MPRQPLVGMHAIMLWLVLALVLSAAEPPLLDLPVVSTWGELVAVPETEVARAAGVERAEGEPERVLLRVARSPDQGGWWALYCLAPAGLAVTTEGLEACGPLALQEEGRTFLAAMCEMQSAEMPDQGATLALYAIPLPSDGQRWRITCPEVTEEPLGLVASPAHPVTWWMVQPDPQGQGPGQDLEEGMDPLRIALEARAAIPASSRPGLQGLITRPEDIANRAALPAAPVILSRRLKEAADHWIIHFRTPQAEAIFMDNICARVMDGLVPRPPPAHDRDDPAALMGGAMQMTEEHVFRLSRVGLPTDAGIELFWVPTGTRDATDAQASLDLVQGVLAINQLRPMLYQLVLTRD